MTRRDGLEFAGDERPCPACGQTVGARHWVSTCPWRHLFRLAVHTQLHIRLDTLCARWQRRAVSPWGIVVLYGPDAFTLSVGSPGDDDPHPGAGVRTLYIDPCGEWEPEDVQYLYDRGLVVGAAQRLLATFVNLWDALDRKRERPIIPAAREVYYREGDGHTWDLAVRVSARFDPTSHLWGSRRAMAGLWPGASLLWPVCERGRVSTVLPPGQCRPPCWGGTQRILWYSDRPLPKSLGRWPGQVREADLVIIDGPGGLPPRRLAWLLSYGPPSRYTGLYKAQGGARPSPSAPVARYADGHLAHGRLSAQGLLPVAGVRFAATPVIPSLCLDPGVFQGCKPGGQGCSSRQFGGGPRARAPSSEVPCAGEGGGIGPRTKPP